MLKEVAAKIPNYSATKGLHEKDKPEHILNIYIYISEFKIHYYEKKKSLRC